MGSWLMKEESRLTLTKSMHMSSPRNVREVQRLIGCLAALGHFLSRSADKSLLFLRALNRKEFESDDEVEQALSAILVAGETLYIYLSVSEYALSAILVAGEKELHT